MHKVNNQHPVITCEVRERETAHKKIYTDMIMKDFTRKMYATVSM